MRNILEVLEFTKNEDCFGLTGWGVLNFMTFEEAKKANILTDEAIKKIESGEEKWESIPYTPQNVLNRIKSYLEFAWDKANDCRGISAWRSIQHFRNWFYMFGDKDIDVLVKELENYKYYGKPWLAIICEILNIDWEKLDDGYWGNSEDEITYLEIEERKSIIEDYKKRIPFNSIKNKIQKLLKGK